MRTEDRQKMLETPARIEPCLFEDDVPRVLAELADLVRMMNSYYSNLIEGHNTRPLDIEKALTGVQIEPEKRPLALEAKAHVEVQRAIDVAHMTNKLPIP